MVEAIVVLVGIGMLIKFFFEQKNLKRTDIALRAEQEAERKAQAPYINKTLEDSIVDYMDPLADVKLYVLCREYIESILGKESTYFSSLERCREKDRDPTYFHSESWYTDVYMLSLIYLSRYGYLPANMVETRWMAIKSGGENRLKDTIKILKNIEDSMASHEKPIHFVMYVPKLWNYGLWLNGFFVEEFFKEDPYDAPHKLVRLNDLEVE